MYTATGTRDRQKWIQQYAPLVKRIAHHIMAKLPASVEVDDIIQAGMMGLMDAVGRMGGHGYATTRDQFELKTPPLAEWNGRRLRSTATADTEPPSTRKEMTP